MPRVKRGPAPARVQHPELVSELLAELKANREAGQPMIEEWSFPKTNNIRATVIWDKWAPLSDEERSAIVWEAYEQAEGQEFRDRIALAIGLTMPEAYELGLLPYEVTTALRKGDPVTPEQCAGAMLSQGASVLFEPGNPRLRFATEQEAAACVQRLVKALPGSESIWVISKEAGRSDQ